MTAEEIRKQNQRLIQQQQAQNAAVRAGQTPSYTGQIGARGYSGYTGGAQQTPAQAALAAYDARGITAPAGATYTTGPTRTEYQQDFKATSKPATGVNSMPSSNPATGAVSPAKQSGGVANSKASSLPTQTPYQQKLDAYDAGVSTPTGQNYDTVMYSDLEKGFRLTEDEAERAKWAQIEDMFAAGDKAGAQALINELSGQGNFYGYFDDAGKYHGFAVGFGGAGNNSYQPVFNGSIQRTGTLDTDRWRTPDGRLLTGQLGADLQDNGDTWSYTDKRVTSLAPTGANTNVPGVSGANGTIYHVNTPVGGTPAIYTDGTSANNSGTPQQTGSPSAQQSERVTDTRQLSAPEAYDPNSDPLFLEYLETWGDYTPEEWDETFDFRQTPEYKKYIELWDQAQAPEYEGDPYQARRDAAIEAYGQEWGGSDYQKKRDEALRRAEEMQFNYDVQTDPSYQSYRKQYIREGRRAMQDAMGQYASMTGGMPSTAAMTAAQQAGNYYNAQLADKVPQLYNDAYQRYLQEYQRQMGISDQYAGFDDREYARWADQQGRNLDLADRYNQYGLQDYSQFLDRLGQWNTDRNFAYGAAMDAIANGRQDYDTRYGEFNDRLDRQARERDFAYGAARDNQTMGRQANNDAYNRYIDALNFAYQQQRDAESDRRYADDTAYKRAMDEYERQMNEAKFRAGYGDYSGLEGMGIDTSDLTNRVYAYAPDGSTYDIGSPKGQYFLQYAGPGQSMTGGDGSTWTKNADGTVTISKGGKTFTYGTPAEETPAAASTYRYTGGRSGSGSSGGETGDYLAQLKAAGITTYNGALSWLAMNAGKLSDTKSKAIAQAFMESLGGDQGTSFSDSDINWARDIMTSAASGKVDVNSDAYKMAQMILSGSGWQFGTGGEAGAAEQNQGAAYNNLAESLDRMAGSGRSRDEIYTEIDAAVRDKQITESQGAALKERYYGQADNVANSGQVHANGLPQSTGFNRVMQEAESKATRGSDQDSMNALADFLMEQYNAGKIHEYEIDIILDRLESR